MWTVAQDLTRQELRWIDAVDAPDALPGYGPVGKSVRVRDSLAEISQPFYRDTLYFVAADKKRPKAMIISQISGSDMLSDVLPSPLRGEFKTPAIRSGKGVASEVRSIVIFNPRTAAVKGDEATPRLLQVVPPQYPRQRGEGDTGKLIAVAVVQVGADGQVTDVTFPPDLEAEFVRLGKRAVSQWVFAPARHQDKPVAGEVIVPVIFQQVNDDGEGKRTPPKLVKGVKPNYPLSMRRANVEGRVKLAFEVTVEGRTKNVYPVESNNPNFEDAAVDAVEQWRFEPAKVNGRPVRTRMGVPVVFAIDGGGASMFSVKRPKSFPESLPEIFKYDEPPEVLNVSNPVYPLDALMEKREGKVTVGFYVGPTGNIEKSVIVKSADPELDAAALTASETLLFKPAVKDGHPSYAALHMVFEFLASGRGDVRVNSDDRRVLQLLTKDRDKLVALTELDAIPEPVSRQPPRYPLSLAEKHPEGHALIEFVIDRRGFARLPRVVEATDPAFGYAAVHAVASWRFTAPRRDGAAVDALVKIPVQFKAD